MIKDITQILLNQENILLKVKEIDRKLDNILSVVNLNYKDRELIVDTNANLSSLKQRIIDNHDHVDNVVEKSKFETSKQIEEVKDIIENKGDEVKSDVVKGIVKGLK